MKKVFVSLIFVYDLTRKLGMIPEIKLTVKLISKFKKKLKNSKYNNMPIKLVQIWEHTFDDMCRNDDELKIFTL